MTTESHEHSPILHADTGDMAATSPNAFAPVPGPSLRAKAPVVRAELVPQPRPPAASCGDVDAARHVRAARRQELLGIFFVHTAGTLRTKHERARALVERVGNPAEQLTLIKLLKNIWDAAQSAPPPEGL
jgi:hypothetical protein